VKTLPGTTTYRSYRQTLLAFFFFSKKEPSLSKKEFAFFAKTG